MDYWLEYLTQYCTSKFFGIVLRKKLLILTYLNTLELNGFKYIHNHNGRAVANTYISYKLLKEYLQNFVFQILWAWIWNFRGNNVSPRIGGL